MTQVILFIVGLIGSIYTYSFISPQLETKDWHFVEGVLEDIQLHKYDRVTHDVKREHAQLSVLYKYEYNNKTYQNATISKSGIGDLHTYEVERLIRQKGWREGKPIHVYINPSNTSESVLILNASGVPKDHWIFLVFFLVLLIGSTINLFIYLGKQFLSEQGHIAR